MRGLKLGEILVRRGTLTQEQVDHVLAVQRSVGRPFGDLVERLFGVDPQAVQDAWAGQYGELVGRTEAASLKVEPGCLTVVSRRQAWQFHVVPVRREDGYLHLATSPESLVRAVNFATRTLAEPAYFVLVERKQMNGLLMKHYPVPNYVAQFADAF